MIDSLGLSMIILLLTHETQKIYRPIIWWIEYKISDFMSRPRPWNLPSRERIRIVIG